MKKFTVAILFIFLSFFCFSCDPPEDYPVKRVLKPYNAKKAGAEIIEKFNLTNDIKFPDKKFQFAVVSDPDYNMITAPYDICVDDTNIYIFITDIIYVFSKDTLVKKHEIKINFSSSDNPEWHYSDFFNNKSQGMAVSGNTALLLGLSSQYNLFSIDLNSGDVILLDDSDILGGETNGGFFRLLGYDRANELFWYRIITANNKYFQYFKYDVSLNKIFICDNKKPSPSTVGKQNDIDNWWVNINGDTAWYTGYSSIQRDRSIKSIGIDKRLIDDPETSLYFIDVEYLGTLSIPQSIAYDEPYIWIMVEREKQIQMLKLLPNG